jgi:hypothetical protein
MKAVPMWTLPWVWPFMKLPLSGDVTQDISPVTSWFPTNIDIDVVGDRAIEAEIAGNIATNGKQLGRLTDAVLALAGKEGYDQNDAIEQLQEIADEVEEVKKRRYRQRAKEALEKLKAEDNDVYSEVLNELGLVEKEALRGL